MLIFVYIEGNCSLPKVDESSAPMWIFFADKGLNPALLEQELSNLNSTYNQKSLQRRIKSGLNASIDKRDLDVNSSYIEEIVALPGIKLRHISRWLNAISVDVENVDLDLINEKSFVRNIQSVRRIYREPAPIIEPIDHHIIDELNRGNPERDWNLDYGRSLRQNLFLNIPRLHDNGLTGTGIIIGVLDAGFDNLDHNCFAEIDILDSWDFVNDDAEVGDEDDRGRGAHGTKTLSIIGGFEAEALIGVAFDATFILGKTENTDWERPIEEDHWVAGIEWMDGLGVDIVSSSLSYSNWYDYEDMDGETGVTTVVAQRAVDIGIIICSSMGNSGRADHPFDKMGAPSDAVGVYSIGAVNVDSSYATWSSIGPTADGRIKPDFTTLGSSVRFAGNQNNENYGNGAGTSFSAPAIAGLCALLLQANPNLNPSTMREVLQNASNNNEDPDTLLGWGIPDGFAALNAIRFEDSELVLNLDAGWSTVSSNLNVLLSQIPEVFSEVVERENLVLVKDGDGRFYSPVDNFNSIPFWNYLQGYQILLSEDDQLIISGTNVSYIQPIELREGWQIVSYLPTFQIGARLAFQSLSDDDNLVLVKDDHGRFYFPQFGFSNMVNCREGKGYQLKLREEDQLIYPRHRLIDFDESNFEIPSYYTLPDPEQNGMSILILAGDNVYNNGEIAFKNYNGDVVGAGVVVNGKCGIALWGGDNESVLSYAEYYSKTEQQFTALSLTKVFGPTGYVPNEVAVYRANSSLKSNVNVVDMGSISLHPNPFNHSITIRLDYEPEPGSRLIIYNTQGQEIYNEIWGDNNLIQKVIESAEWASGNYYFKLTDNGKSTLGTANHLK